MMLFSQIPIPEHMPDGSLQAIIWIAIACVGGMFSAMVVGARWLLSYLDAMRNDTKELSNLFTTETKNCRDTFRAESEAVRAAHSRDLAAQQASYATHQDKAFEAFERHVERLSAAIEGKK